MSLSFSLLPRYIRLPIWAAMLVGLASCSAGTDSVSGPSAPSSALEASRFFYSLPVATVSVSPSSSSMTAGQSLQLTATARTVMGSTVSGDVVSWTTSNAAVLTVSSAGVVSSVASGSATVSATVSGKTGTASITVSAAATTTAAITAPATVNNLGVSATNDTTATLSFTEVSDGNGGAANVDVRYAVAPISWGSATSATRGTCATGVTGLTVGKTATCTVLGLTKGTSYNFQLVTYRGTLNQNAVFGAVSNIASGTTTSTATTPPAAPVAPVVAVVAVTPATATATVGVKLQLSATVKDNNNNVMTGQHVTWASSNKSIATVDTTGAVMGVNTGTATFTATVSSAAGTAVVTEAAAVTTPVAPPVTPPVTPPAAPSNGSYPNQPAGFTRFAEMNFSSLPGLAGTSGAVAGNWWNYQDKAGHLTIQSDPTAPQSAPSVLQMDFETGTQAGYDDADQSTRAFGGWATADFNGNETTYSEIYESTRFKLPGTNFENQEVGAKILGYWGVGENNTGGTPTQVYSQMRGNGTSTAIGTAFPLDLKMQGTAYANYPQNMNLGTLITVGVWHQFEVHMKLNDIGASNGVMDWWLDGVQIGHYTNVVFRTSQYPSGFWGRQYDPVWGGGGGAAKTRTDYLWIDHTYLSGVP